MQIGIGEVTRLFDSIGSASFAQELHRQITELVRFDFLSVDYQRGNTGLQILCRSALSYVDHEGITARYREKGLFEQDPARDLLANGIHIADNCYYLRTSRSHLGKDSQHSKLYQDFSIGNRINIGKKIGEDHWIKLKLIRLDHFGDISPRAEIRLKRLAPFYSGLCHNHFRLTRSTPTANSFQNVTANKAQLRGLLGKLSARELDVLALNLSGAANKAVAAELGISVNTVITLRQRGYKKLGVHNLLDLQQKLALN